LLAEISSPDRLLVLRAAGVLARCLAVFIIHPAMLLTAAPQRHLEATPQNISSEFCFVYSFTYGAFNSSDCVQSEDRAMSE
jgi:hypothetical protein